jgi:peptidoglycan/xylan/chitin deacetylase (PgdA/CDA1 family)
VAGTIAAALTPGGLLLATHSRLAVDEPDGTGFDWHDGFGAATINDVLAATSDLAPVRELRTPYYRCLLLQRGRPGMRAASPHPVIEATTATPPPAVAAHFYAARPALTQREAVDTLVTRALPILMYHRIAHEGPPALATWRAHPELFEAQLDWLRRNGFRSISLSRWRQVCERGTGEVPGRAVCLTFDDGYEDFATTAWPLLRAYGFFATVFLVAERLGRSADWDARYGRPAPLMDAATIRSLAAEGVVFGGHTATHPALTRIGPRQLAYELTASRQDLEAALNVAVHHFAYPYGFHDSLVRHAVEVAGYDLAVTTVDGFARLGDDPLRLPRLKVAGEDDLATFVRRLDARVPAPPLTRWRRARDRRRGRAAWAVAR